MLTTEISQIVFEVTYRCQSNCQFCYNCWKYQYQPLPELTLDQYQQLMQKLPKTKQIAISGGEPLLRHDLREIILALKRLSPNILVITSGIQINNEIARMFKELNVRVQISLHGLEDTHNALTRTENAYQRAIQGIAWLKRNDVKYGITTVVNKKNINEIKQVFELGVALDAQQLQVIRFMPGGEGIKNQDLMLNAREYIKMMEDLDGVCKNYGIIGVLGAPNTPCSFPDEKYKHISKGMCGAGVDWFAIDPSGRMRICNHSPTILGDLTQQSFADIWAHPLLEKFRTNQMIPKACDGCKRRDECKGGCRAVAETYYGDISAPDPLMTCVKR